ncbi:MAG: nitrate reductase cytochrome c-type subunit [Candidatus Thiodiazotropha sp.]|nr:nitrate reductase cytochrome c-type subunit [Candidatus Thiodiazotropha sp.]MCM8882218.1 nitrate reductase cytochrome c-type subunit [Candidatus Thiodiazotropha sp.]MCM8919603.1 nitrate reductase cytochrome c-type subunit [Candidatus Thiodiazotropha sp.]
MTGRRVRMLALHPLWRKARRVYSLASRLPGTNRLGFQPSLALSEGGIERSYKLQPPMVPHEVDKYEINLKNNGCMKCHSEATYEKEKAPKVGDSHYEDRDGKVLKTVSSRRYFCNQCHAPQMGADPLVQNNFQGAK